MSRARSSKRLKSPGQLSIDAFISHNFENSEIAGAIYDQIKTRGKTPWVDIRAPKIDQWRGKIPGLIKDSRCFLALFGSHVGQYQRPEIELAIKLNDANKIRFIKGLVPGYDKPTDPDFLIAGRYYILDFREGLTDTTLANLITLIDQADTNFSSLPAVNNKNPRRILMFSGGSGSRTGLLCELLAQRLTEMLGPGSCCVLSMSRYYVGGTDTSSVEFANKYGLTANFDDPKLIDWPQMIRDIGRLMNGLSVQSPEYSKTMHALREFDALVSPSRLLLLEGTFLLQNRDIRELSAATFVVHVKPEILMANRISKDLKVYNMDLDDVLRYYVRAVKPAFDNFLSAQYAIR